MWNCFRCKKSIAKSIRYDHKCHSCGVIFCRACDDATLYLMWEELNGVDRYMCEKCRKGLESLIEDSRRMKTE